MGARWSVWRRWFLVTLVSSVGPGYELGYRWPLGLVLAGGMLVHVGSVRACTWLLRVDAKTTSRFWGSGHLGLMV